MCFDFWFIGVRKCGEISIKRSHKMTNKIGHIVYIVYIKVKSSYTDIRILSQFLFDLDYNYSKE